MGDSYASLLERIETPQPSMQRFAVIAIFEKLRSAPPHLSVQSEAGREALFRCLHSPTGAVVDQAVRQLCLFVQEGHMSPPQGLQELQAVLDASPPHSVEVIAKGIGFLCRFVYTSRSPHISTVFASPELHPLVKAAVSRVEAHAELLQQAVLFINILDSDDFDRFIRPVLAFAVLNSNAHACFGRRLHSHLASLSCAYPPRGLSIFKLLVEFIAYYPHRTTQEIGIVIASAEELVSAFESILSKPAGKVEHARLCGAKLSESLIALCSNLSEHGLGSSSALVLLERLMLVQKDHDQFRRDDFNSMTAPLAHMLAAAEYEHEQLLLLNISIVFLQWKREKGLSSLQGIVMDFPLEVLFIFPVVHVMSSPSMAVKRTAASLLLVLEGILGKLWSALPSSPSISQGGLCYSHKVGVVVHQLLQQMWSQDKGLVTWSDHSSSAYPQWSGLPGSKNRSEAWLEHLKRSYSKKGEGSRSILVSQHYGRLRRGGILLSCMLVTALVMHPTLGRLAIKALAAIGRFEPMLGVSILLVVLFYLKVFYKCASKSQQMLLELLEVLPSLACNSVTVPLIIQILQPMLHRDAKLELRATAVRLLCRTWEVTDHAFAHLQVALQPKGFLASTLEMDLLISMAASVRDVCKQDADRGVDLVLSIQACIESENSTVRALGLQSLAHLCEADVVDFYTAWAVIGKHFPKVPPVPNIANGLCILLCWGAMDAEAYTEASKGVLKLIWEAAASKDLEHSDMWLKTRISAMEALTFYDVGYAQRCLPGFNSKLVELLLSEFNPEMQCILEKLVVKTLIHEHGTRRRLQREGRVGISKVEKLLHVLPQILFHSEGKEKTAADIPGAALLCLIFSPPARTAPRKGSLRHLQKWQSKYGNALVEIAGSLQLSRNILVALLSLHSWTSFMQRWLRAKMMVFEAEDMPGMQEKIPIKAADGIFKDICNAAELAVPRVAENLALALGALCMVLPSSAHSVTFAVSNFLLDWLGEDAHEYKQWPAAISLGLVSVCLHATDWEHRHKIIHGLLKTGSLPSKTIVSILKCLEKAPRLPALDWGGIMRRFMRYKDHTSKHKVVSVPNNKTCVQSCEVREECVHFSFVHAQRIPALLTFLDELCGLSRFSLLEYTLQSSLLFHMLDMQRIFSESRMEKFFNDIMEFFSMQSVSKIQDKEAAQDDVNSGSLRTSFWKSLYKCLTEGSPHTDENYLCYIEKCMEIMFQLLPLLPLSFSEICNSGSRSTLDEEEWSEAVNCLMSAPKTWVLNFLQVITKASVETEEASATMIKVILARARLVANMYIPPLELGKARSYLLSEKSNGIWRLLVEVSAALRHMTIDVKRQWLLDTIETGCITRYPSTALQFLGLLVGSWSPYASCLILDPTSVLQDLPLTLPSLFLDNNWISILDLVTHKLLSLTERIYNWLACLKKGEYTTIACSFETSEEQSSHLLLDVMQQTCISLRDHFSFDAQFKLISSRIL